MGQQVVPGANRSSRTVGCRYLLPCRESFPGRRAALAKYLRDKDQSWETGPENVYRTAKERTVIRVMAGKGGKRVCGVPITSFAVVAW